MKRTMDAAAGLAMMWNEVVFRHGEMKRTMDAAAGLAMMRKEVVFGH